MRRSQNHLHYFGHALYGVEVDTLHVQVINSHIILTGWSVPPRECFLDLNVQILSPQRPHPRPKKKNNIGNVEELRFH